MSLGFLVARLMWRGAPIFLCCGPCSRQYGFEGRGRQSLLRPVTQSSIRTLTIRQRVCSKNWWSGRGRFRKVVSSCRRHLNLGRCPSPFRDLCPSGRGTVRGPLKDFPPSRPRTGTGRCRSIRRSPVSRGRFWRAGSWWSPRRRCSGCPGRCAGRGGRCPLRSS